MSLKIITTKVHITTILTIICLHSLASCPSHSSRTKGVRNKLTIPVLINLLIVVIHRISNERTTKYTRAQAQCRTTHHAHTTAATGSAGTAVGLLLWVASSAVISLLRGITTITLLGIAAVSNRWSLLRVSAAVAWLTTIWSR